MAFYYAQYFAYRLTKRCASDTVEKLAGAVAEAQVDLNPRQLDAALFALRSPLSRSALLADEVGESRSLLIVCSEWGKDDDSLKVETLLKAPLPKRQQELNL